jgi:hypothetical protein
MPPIIAGNQVDASEIVAEFGAQYKNNGQNMARIIKRIYQRSFTPSIARKIQTVETVYDFAEDQIGEVAQGYQQGWTPKGVLKLTPRQIALRRMKIDISVQPDEVVASWAEFLANLDDAQRKNWPLIVYMWDRVMTRKESDLESKAYYKGVYAAPSTGVAGNATALLDGLKKQALEAIANGGNDYASLVGNLDPTTIFDQVEAFSAKILEDYNELLEGEQMVLCMSNYWKYKYLKDKRDTLGTNINYDPNKLTVDFLDNIKIVGLPSMAGTNDMFATVDNNIVHLYNRLMPPKPAMNENRRAVDIYTDWREGIGFAFNEYVFTAFEQGSGSGS